MTINYLNSKEEAALYLSEFMNKFKNGEIPPAALSSVSKAIGKIIAIARGELEYRKQRGEKPFIPFYDVKNGN